MLLASSFHASASADDAVATVGLDELQGSDELLLFGDLPVVISATRREVALHMSPVPISVVTAEDIHFSGLASVPEILQFTPGVDFLRVDRNRDAWGVRGLHDPTGDRTLTLINGRSAVSQFFGGPELWRQPLFVEDIERIEVVRGPGGAAWGANAFHGVVNIITKRPEDVPGLFVTSTFNIHGETYSQLRWGASHGDLAWRFSAGYRNHRASTDVIRPKFTAVPGFMAPAASNDFERSPAIDSEFAYQFSEVTRLTAGIGYRHVKRGSAEFVGFMPDRNEEHHTTRAFAKLETEFDGGGSGYLQWFGNVLDSDEPRLSKVKVVENDLEAQLNFSPGGGHDLSIGGNVRWARIKTAPSSDEPFIYRGTPFDDLWAGLFAMDRFRLSERTTIEGQARVDWYSETGVDWSGRIALLQALDEDSNHILRVSGARAFRAPLTGFRHVEFGRVPVAPGLFAFNMIENPDLKNERIWAAEAGYAGRLAPEVTLRADGYYQWYENLIGVRSIPDPMGFGRSFFVLDNLAGAEAAGAEFELAWTPVGGRLSAWYALNTFWPAQPGQDVRAFGPARHKFGLTGRLNLPAEFTANANYKWSARTRVPGSTQVVPSFHRLDLTLAKSLGGRGELMIGVADVFDQTRLSVFGLGDLTSHEVPGRTVFFRIQATF